jgi:transposase-like protein
MLQRMFAVADVKTYLALSDTTRRKKGNARHRYVDPAEVDRAIVEWLDTERPADAARRHGLKPSQLYHWLRSGGIWPKADARPYFCVRLPSDVIDRVVAERRAKKNATTGAGE